MEFCYNRHVKYFERCLKVLPTDCCTLDTSRLTVAFFAISGLDLLQALDSVDLDKANTIEWIYSLQVLPQGSQGSMCGFRGSTWLSSKSQDGLDRRLCIYDSGHLAMTYSALLCLLILGDDLSRVSRYGISSELRACQLPDGSFSPTHEGLENDMRFVYCACCVAYILDDWSGINHQTLQQFIMACLTHEGAFGQNPGAEAHGGSTFCAVASLHLMGKLDLALSARQRKRLTRWCLRRQNEGFQGRPNKPQDTCYSFWVGATLQLLNAFQFTDFEPNRHYLLDTQDVFVGGFSKWPGGSPDPLHAYFGICGLSMLNEVKVMTMNPALNISERAARCVTEMHLGWGSCNNLAVQSYQQSSTILLQVDEHISYLKSIIFTETPPNHQILDICRLNVIAVSSISLQLLKSDLLEEHTQSLTSWVYSKQTCSKTKGESEYELIKENGSVVIRTNVQEQKKIINDWGCMDCQNNHLDLELTQLTSSAISLLLTLKDDLGQLARSQILHQLQFLLQDGVLQQCSLPLLYQAVWLSTVLGNSQVVNTEGLVELVCTCQQDSGGYSSSPGLESTPEATFYAVAVLYLLEIQFKVLTEERQARLVQWCVTRIQEKCSVVDRVWTLLTLRLLCQMELVDHLVIHKDLIKHQNDQNGGFTDPLHNVSGPSATFMCLAGLVVLRIYPKQLDDIHPALLLPEQTIQHLLQIQQANNWMLLQV